MLVSRDTRLSIQRDLIVLAARFGVRVSRLIFHVRFTELRFSTFLGNFFLFYYCCCCFVRCRRWRVFWNKISCSLGRLSRFFFEVGFLRVLFGWNVFGFLTFLVDLELTGSRRMDRGNLLGERYSCRAYRAGFLIYSRNWCERVEGGE